jgi:hypothetical protein
MDLAAAMERIWRRGGPWPGPSSPAPRRGGLAIRSRWKRNHAALGAYEERAAAKLLREDAGPSRTALDADPGRNSLGRFGVVLAKGPGTAERTVKEALITSIEN